MKKKKCLAAILIASSAFLGTGYAWWTEDLQVEHVISTGEFKVVGVEGKIIPEVESMAPPGKQNKGTDHQVEMLTKTETQIDGFSYFITDLYPQKAYGFTARFENQGSIPAVVADIEISKQLDNEGLKEENLFKHLRVTGVVKVIGKDVPTKEAYEYRISKEDNVTLEDLEDKLKENITNWRLEETESILFEDFKVKLVNVGYQKESKHNPGEGREVSFHLKISFKQHNAQ